jgi:hypothetical protein
MFPEIIRKPAIESLKRKLEDGNNVIRETKRNK